MKNIEYLYYVWLNEIKGIGPITARGLIDHFDSPEKVYNSSMDELLEVKGIGEKTVKVLLDSRGLEVAQDIIDKCIELNINIVSYKDANYPINMKSGDMPILLYYKGTLKRQKIIGIVGSRRCTEYGKRVTIEIAEKAVKNNFAIISGMAKGVDSYAHTACIKNNGYTIAVLGSGIDICYPKENLSLYNAIAETGCLLSEYAPGTKINQKYFIKRNRIIAAMCHKLIVTQASLNSGSLHTAKYAMEYNKEVIAVSGGIYSEESMGCNKLISRGAKIYINHHELKENKSEHKTLENKESRIINILREKGSLSMDGILEVLAIEEGQLMEELFELQLEGILVEKSGKFSTRAF